MIQWLYRYVFRGLGVLILVGMITILILAISSQSRQSADKPTAPPAGVRR